jgi:hypothetical protein
MKEKVQGDQYDNEYDKMPSDALVHRIPFLGSQTVKAN